jgi:serine protease Do
MGERAMRAIALWFSLSASLACALSVNCANANVAVQSWGDIAQQVIPATVNVWAERLYRSDNSGSAEQRKTFSGSGFIVDPSGEVVTNRHLIEGAFSITVTLNDGTELPAQLAAAAALVDVAVLKVEAGRTLPSLKLANSDAARVGDPVLAVGNPLGIGTSLSAGIISALNRDLRDSPMDDYIQTDAAINYGNSGGPLIDTNGEVVGLNSALVTTTKTEGSMGLGFAISSSVLTSVLHHLRDHTAVGWIGTHVQDTSPDLAKAFGLRTASGVIVTAVDANSPAQEAGLQSSDIILRYGRDKPFDARALMRDIGQTPVGAMVDLLIWQSGHERTIPMRVRAWPNLIESSAATPDGRDTQSPPRSLDLGMLLEPVTDAARKRYAIRQMDGLVVVAIDNESEAYAKGITLGDVIEKVQDAPVSTPREFRRLVQEAADQNETVALLVHRKAGPEWIALHIGGGRLARAPGEGPLAAGPRSSGTEESASTDRPIRR